MENRADAFEFALPRRHSVRIRDGKGLIVEVVEGCLWLTQDQDRKDYIAEAGESVAIERGGVTYVSACSAARIRLRRFGAECTAAIEMGGGFATGTHHGHLPLSAFERLRAGASVLVRFIATARPAPQ